MRILVTGCGGAAASNFIQSLRMSDEKYYIVGTDTSKYNIHLSRADNSYISTPITDESYLDNLNDIIKKEEIDMVHAQPDTEVLFLSRKRKKVNAILVTGRLALAPAPLIALTHALPSISTPLNNNGTGIS